MRNGGKEQTGRRIARHHGGTAVATGANAFARVELQTALRLPSGSGMALVAVFHQHRADLGFEECNTIGVFIRGLASPSNCAVDREEAQKYEQQFVERTETWDLPSRDEAGETRVCVGLAEPGDKAGQGDS